MCVCFCRTTSQSLSFRASWLRTSSPTSCGVSQSCRTPPSLTGKVSLLRFTPLSYPSCLVTSLPVLRSGVRALAERLRAAAVWARPVSRGRSDRTGAGAVRLVEERRAARPAGASELWPVSLEHLPGGSVPRPHVGPLAAAARYVSQRGQQRHHLFERVTDQPLRVSEVMERLSACYSSLFDELNAEVQIRWLQMVVRNTFYPDLPRVRTFLHKHVRTD